MVCKPLKDRPGSRARLMLVQLTAQDPLAAINPIPRLLARPLRFLRPAKSARLVFSNMVLLVLPLVLPRRLDKLAHLLDKLVHPQGVNNSNTARYPPARRIVKTQSLIQTPSQADLTPSITTPWLLAP